MEGAEELEKLNSQPKELRAAIGQRLADQARPGSPGKFSAEPVCQLIALAGETPPEPLSRWTLGELVKETINRKIVKTLSTSSAGRLLKSGRPQTAPHKILAQSRS